MSIRQAIEFYLGDEFRINDQPLSDQFRTADLADPGFFDDIAHFLVAISVPYRRVNSHAKRKAQRRGVIALDFVGRSLCAFA